MSLVRLESGVVGEDGVRERVGLFELRQLARWDVVCRAFLKDDGSR